MRESNNTFLDLYNLEFKNLHKPNLKTLIQLRFKDKHPDIKGISDLIDRKEVEDTIYSTKFWGPLFIQEVKLIHESVQGLKKTTLKDTQKILVAKEAKMIQSFCDSNNTEWMKLRNANILEFKWYAVLHILSYAILMIEQRYAILQEISVCTFLPDVGSCELQLHIC
jgi:hypothetical protein